MYTTAKNIAQSIAPASHTAVHRSMLKDDGAGVVGAAGAVGMEMETTGAVTPEFWAGAAGAVDVPDPADAEVPEVPEYPTDPVGAADPTDPENPEYEGSIALISETVSDSGTSLDASE